MTSPSLINKPVYGDFVNAVSADVIEWCSSKKFDEFLAIACPLGRPQGPQGSISTCTNLYTVTWRAPNTNNGCSLFSSVSRPMYIEMNDLHSKTFEHELILGEIEFQKLRVARSSVLAKYEPKASRVNPD